MRGTASPERTRLTCPGSMCKWDRRYDWGGHPPESNIRSARKDGHTIEKWCRVITLRLCTGQFSSSFLNDIVIERMDIFVHRARVPIASPV